MVSQLCARDIMWKMNNSILVGVDEQTVSEIRRMIINKGHVTKCTCCNNKIRTLSDDMKLIIGTFIFGQKSGNACGDLELFYTIVVKSKACVKMEYVQIDVRRQKTRIYKINAVNESVHFIKENEIIYVESFKDHLIWHMENKTIESIATLKSIEEELLSKEFVRIHRSYLVNKNCVTSIERCYVTMSDGEKLPIPYKKYVEMRKKLTE